MSLSKLTLSKKDFIDYVVDEFYRQATTDILIGHQFRKIALKERDLLTSDGPTDHHPLRPPLEAFAHHLPRIKSFWYIQLIGESKMANQAPFDLIQIHRELSIRMGELNRWLVLFDGVLMQSLKEVENVEEMGPFVQLWREKVSLFENRFKNILF